MIKWKTLIQFQLDLFTLIFQRTFQLTSISSFPYFESYGKRFELRKNEVVFSETYFMLLRFRIKGKLSLTESSVARGSPLQTDTHSFPVDHRHRTVSPSLSTIGIGRTTWEPYRTLSTHHRHYIPQASQKHVTLKKTCDNNRKRDMWSIFCAMLLEYYANSAN